MKKLKILTVVLTVVLITMVAFWGIYVSTQNRMENIVKDYSYMADLKGARNVVLTVDTSNKTVIKDADGHEVTDAEDLTDEEISEKGYVKEEVPYNSEDVLNSENYKKSKDVIEKRLNQIIEDYKKTKISNSKVGKTLELEYYNIRESDETGNIVIELPENKDTDSIVSGLSTVGKFEIIDSNTKEVLMDNNDLKLVNVLYGSDNQTATSSGTIVYLNIEFNDEGTKKLEEISNKYKAESEDSQENEDGDEHDHEHEETSEVTLMVDDNELVSTGFEEPVKTGKIQLSVGRSSTDEKTLQDYSTQASNMAVVLNNGNMPIKYTLQDNQYILSDITSNDLNVAFYIVLGIVGIALIVLIIRYKAYGLLSSISFVGLASLLLLTIRYTNVNLSIQGLLGIITALTLNYIFITKILSKINSNEYKKSTIGEIIKNSYKEFFIRIIPICIAVIVLCLGWPLISSFGMVMFWGLVLIALYNVIVTNILLRIQKNK